MISEDRAEKLPRWRWTIEHWSPSNIELLWECPRKFEYTIVQQRDVPTNASLAFGLFLHGCFKRFFNERETKQGPKIGYKDRQAFVGQGARLWREILEGQCGPRGFGTPPVKIRWLYPGQEDALWDRLFIILNAFWRDNQDYLTDKFLFPMVEKRLTAKLPSFRFGEHRVSGVLDRIQPVAGGKEIWDYKTGQDLPSVEYLKQHPVMAFYEVLFWQNFGQGPLAVKLYYPHYGIAKGLIGVPLRPDHREERIEQLIVWLDEATRAVLEVMDPQALGESRPSRFLDPLSPGRFSKQPGDPKCWLCDFHKICVADHAHGSAEEQIKMIERAEARMTSRGEQLKLNVKIPGPVAVHPRSIWKRQATLQLKKQRK